MNFFLSRKKQILFFASHAAFFSLLLLFTKSSFWVPATVFYFIIGASFLALAALTKKTSGKIVVTLIFFLYLIYNLANLAYFKVFGSFFLLETVWTTRSHAPISMLARYYDTVPAIVYVFSAAVIFSWLWLILKKNKPNLVKFCGAKLKDRTRIIKQISILIFLLAINFYAVLFFKHLEKNPRSNWWDAKAQAAESGVSGMIYKQALKSTADPIQQIEPAHALEKTDTPEKPPENEYSLIKTALNKMNLTQKSNSISLPTFQTPPNIIFYQLESISEWAGNAEPDPLNFFHELQKNNVSVDKFFANGCHTISAEFASLCGMFPDSEKPISDMADRVKTDCLPKILKEKFNYRTAVYHSNIPEFWNREELTPEWGFLENYFLPYFPYEKMDDLKVLSEAIKHIKESKQPSFAYVIGYTSHSPHSDEGIKWNAEKNHLKIASFPGEISPSISDIELGENALRAYLGYVRAVDDMIRDFFALLDKENLRENTIVVIFGDHRYYSFVNPTVENFYLYNELPFVMALPNQETTRLPAVASHVDIPATVLHILNGNENAQPENFLGRSLFSDKPTNPAINKCHGNISAISEDYILRGNSNFDFYNFFGSAAPKDDQKKQSVLRNMSTVISVSDKILIEDYHEPISVDGET